MVIINYVTRVNLSEFSAQSIQIRQMSRAFAKSSEFKLYCPGKLDTDLNQTELKIFGGGYLKYCIFLIYCLIYFLLKSRKKNIIYTRDIAASLMFALLGFKTCYELHQPWKTSLSKFLFLFFSKFHHSKIITITSSLKTFLLDTAPDIEKKILVAHDGVDTYFHKHISQKSKNLRLSQLRGQQQFSILHTGSLYKGAFPVLCELAILLKEAQIVHIGGSLDEIKKYKCRTTGIENLKLYKNKPHQNISAWQQSADYLVYINTKNNNNYWCTSPLKIFEYLTSRTPLISISEGSTDEILIDGSAYQLEPDNLEKLKETINNSEMDLEQISNYYKENYCWAVRSKKIIEFIF